MKSVYCIPKYCYTTNELRSPAFNTSDIMKILVLYISLSVAFIPFTSAQASTFRFVCYFTQWSKSRPGKGKFLPENIDPSLCTHIAYAFAKPENNYLVPLAWDDDDTPPTPGMYSRIMKMKAKNAALKVLLSVGGNYKGPDPFISVVSTEESSKLFATYVVTFLRTRKFDGLDVAWAYSPSRGSTAQYKQKFTSLMQILRQVFDIEAKRTGKPRLILSLVGPSGKYDIDKGYMIPELSKVVDFISIITYDYHGGWENNVGFNSPLYPLPVETGNARRLNANWTANYYVSLGAPKDKLNIGIATYGRSFILQNRNRHGVTSPASGEGKPGPYTGASGIMAYYEICELIKSGANTEYVPFQECPYVVKGNLWVGYDDKTSVLKKACYAKTRGFGGLHFWTLDLDDFSGSYCGEGMYPLIKSARSVINGSFDTICKDHSKTMLFSTSDGTRSIQDVNLGAICLCLLIGFNYMMFYKKYVPYLRYQEGVYSSK